MAMETDGMGNAIVAAIAAVPPLQSTDPADIAAYHADHWKAIGNAITDYIKDNSELEASQRTTVPQGFAIVFGSVK